MKILHVLAGVLLLASASQSARADDTQPPEAVQAASELLAVISPDMVKQMMAQMNATLWPALEQKARAGHIDDGTIAEMRRAFERIQLSLVTNMLKDAPALYARHFTVAELHDLIAFYHTPTGVKTLSELPKVMGELSAMLMPHLQDVQRQTSDAFTTILRNHGYIK